MMEPTHEPENYAISVLEEQRIYMLRTMKLNDEAAQEQMKSYLETVRQHDEALRQLEELDAALEKLRA